MNAATIEELCREQKLIEQQIAKQVIEDKNRKIWELERRVELLETMLNRGASLSGALPQPQPLPAIRSAPKRWSVR